MEEQDKKAIIEAALFLSEEPMSVDEIAEIINIGSRGFVQQILDELKEDFRQEGRGLEIIECDEGYEMKVKREHIDKVSDLAPYRDISEGVLRTLALIAYENPVKQSRIVDIRGNRAYSQVKELKNRGLIEAEKEGRTKVLSVTKDFLDYFGFETPEEFKMYFSSKEGQEEHSVSDRPDLD